MNIITRKNGIRIKKQTMLILSMLPLSILGVVLFTPCDTHAAAKQSALSLGLQSNNLSITLSPTSQGTFGESNSTNVSVITDNFTGYSLTIDAMDDGTSLVNSNDDEIESLSSTTSSQDFSTSSTYNNKWGLKPSQYITSSGGIDTTVYNTDYLPAPSSQDLLLDRTTAANSSVNTYSLSFGARAATDMPSGTYTGTLVITAVPNTIIYNISYDDNTTETVTNMPSPNPQELSISGGTPAADSYGVLSSAVPTMTTDDMSFGGWCSVQTTVNPTTGNYECSGTTYQPGDHYPIDQTADGTNIVLYAIWIEDPFPMVWSQMGKCIFHGNQPSNITGSECQDYQNDLYIDTGVALYSQENYLKDYEIHLTIDRYNPSENLGNDGQQTFVSDKVPSTTTIEGNTAPGLVVRKSGNDININNKMANDQESVNVPSSGVSDLTIYRINNVIYYSLNHGTLVELEDTTGYNQFFDLTTWIGGYPATSGCTGSEENPCSSAKRFIEAEFSNMYIRLGDFDETKLHEITFNANTGSPATTTYTIVDGNPLGTLPTVIKQDWVFVNWYTAQQGGTVITSSTIPTADTTYWAHWLKDVSQAQITNPNIALEQNQSKTIEVTNSAELEPYRFTSNNTSIATVNETTGVVTGITNGTTTITMTGTMSGVTRTIDVTVASQTVTLTFNAGGGTPVEPVDVALGGSISSLPISIRSGYTLEGWYSGQDGTGTQLTTSLVFDSNTPTNYYANWIEATYTCVAATELHKETCNRDSNGCRSAGYAKNAEITYGSLIASGATSLSPGNALTCDINANGKYDEETERFYYYATNGDNAELIWYQNISNVNEGYTAGLDRLPDQSTSGWTNTNLVVFGQGDFNGKNTRYMSYSEAVTACGNSTSGLGANGKCLYILEKSNFANTEFRDGYWLGSTNNSRVQTAARSITSNSSNNGVRPVIEVPLSKISLDPPASTYDITFNPHNGGNSTTVTITAGNSLGPDFPSVAPTYTDHVFQGWYTAATGGTQVTSSTVPDGNKTYHAQWKGSVALANITNTNLNVLESGTVNIDVTNSSDIEPYTFSSNNSSIATVDSNTGVVTGVATGSTTITMTGTDSHDTRTINVTVLDPGSTYNLTFDPHNGSATIPVTVPVGSAISSHLPSAPTYTDHVFQGWYTAATGGTQVTSATIPDGNNTYHAQWKLNVQQAEISNDDLTLPEDGQITILVSNSADLEPYSFTSNNPNIATVTSDTGVITGISAGTTTIRMTGEQSGDYLDLEVDVTAAPPTMYTVTFDHNGGSGTASMNVEDGTAIGNLPTSDRTNYRFFGWYTDDDTFYQEVTPETTITGDITFHAKWVEDTTNFPIIWAETNACTFDGGSHNVSGTYCDANNKTKTYIDTGVQLFTEANYDKDFELGFTIVSWDPSSNTNQATFVNSKQENSSNNYPGFVVRRESSTNNVQLTQKWKGDNGATQPLGTNSTLKSVRVARQNGVIYYAINNGNMTPLQDISQVTRLFFDTKVWFGASVQSNGTSTQRLLTGTLTDMYVRLGTDTEYTVNFDANGGTASPTSKTITIGDRIGTLPTVTPPSSNYTFDNWYDESVDPAVVIDQNTVPTANNKTYVAHWTYHSSDTPVTFDVSNNATRGYQTIVNSWAQSPVNLTTFNKDTTTINNSTWGDTTALPEATYWSTLKTNFQTNQCMVPSYGDATTTTPNPTAWSSGSIDCSKPDAYDTKINAALDVYTYDLANSTKGAQVTYAKADSGIIHNMIPGQTYYWEKSDDSSVYGYVTATSPNGRRWVDTGKIRNARDLGGLPVDTDGDGTTDATSEYGKLFRGERLWNAPATELTNLGINKEYDLSDGQELGSDTKLSQYKLDQVIHYNFETYDSTSTSNYMRAWNAVTDIMDDVANNGKNIYLHCRIGADRTGTTAYLLEGLLGVPDEARYEEYSLSHLSGLYDRTRYYKQKSSSNALKFVFMMGYVKTSQDIYNWYMQNPNADITLIAKFRSEMTGVSYNTILSALQANNNNNNQNNQNNPLNTNSIGGNQSQLLDTSGSVNSPSSLQTNITRATVATAGIATSFLVLTRRKKRQ